MKFLKISLFFLLCWLTYHVAHRDILGVSYRASDKMTHDQFWKEKVVVEVGPEQPFIPMQLPGVLDNWAGSAQSEIRIIPPFRDSIEATLTILDSHEQKPPLLAVYAGETLIKSFQVRKGSGRAKWKLKGVHRYTEKFTVPAQYMAEGFPIVIRNEKGSWVALHKINLRSPAPIWMWAHVIAGWGAVLLNIFYLLWRGPNAKEKTLLASLYAVFALSGFSALVYQVAWQRMIGLFSGSDSVSSAIVVGAFLLGIGAGSLLGGWIADRLANRTAFIIFGFLEFGTAWFALSSKTIYYDLMFEKLIPLSSNYGVIFIIVFASLLLPTTLMGMSLPLLSKATTSDITLAPGRIGALYGVNTFGAGIGALAAGLYLIGTYGYVDTIRLAAALNIFAGLTALFLVAARLVSPDSRLNDQALPLAGAEPGKTPWLVWRWCFLALASGFISISLEMIWFRCLGLLTHSSPYSFSLALGVFLLGDAAGIIIGAKVSDRVKDTGRLFVLMQGAVAIYALAALWVVYVGYGDDDYFAYLNNKTHLRLVAENLTVIGLLSFFIILPPAVIMGMSFPVIHKAVQNDRAVVGRRVGLIQISNIFGNVAGSIVTGLFIFRVWGTSTAVKITAAVACVLLITLILWRKKGGDTRPHKRMTSALAAVALAWVFLFPSSGDLWSRFVAGGDAQCSVEEDHTGVTALCHDRAHMTLYNNGKDQGYLPFSNRHIFNSVFGPIVHPNPEKMLIIGVGGGGQAYTLGLNPATQKIRAVEIVHPVYDVLRGFAASGGRMGIDRLLADKRYDFGTGDGRRELFLTSEKYDIIQPDAITAVEAQSGLLYSVEFFTQVRETLEDDGLALQWVPTERASMTFLSVFPYVVQVNSLMIGSKMPIPFSMPDILARIEQPQTRNYLKAGHVDVAALVETLRSAQVKFFTPDSKPAISSVNTDLFPKDEFFLNTPVEEE
ncbi:MAG: fused MFS/spermidine synthase [Nitrospinae bacterium]|nr:fused MFS/spermidine synthase [Nitrospinota bacterium]